MTPTSQLRAARQAALIPLLQKRGVQLIQREAGNFELPTYKGLILKESYWRWPERNMAGNTIDFLVKGRIPIVESAVFAPN